MPRQDIPATQVETLCTSFTEILGGKGAKVLKTEQWGLRNLAYRIKKNKKGHYVLMNLDASPEAITEFERNMSLNEDVLRFMTVRVDELETGPSAMLRKDERPERTGFGGPGGDRPRRAPMSGSEPREGDAA